MLIEFSVTNYRSFKDTQTLSMVAGSAKEHLETHTFDSGIQTFDRLLASSVIYGPNAAGKTNLLKGLQFMQSLVINSAASSHTTQLPYTPFLFDEQTREAPSEFEVTFVEDGVRYQYGFSIDSSRVHREWLIEYRTRNPSRMFERSYDSKKKQYEWSFSLSLKGNKSVWRDATRENALFLSTAVQLNSTQLLQVFWWFQKRLVTVIGATAFNFAMTLRLLDEPGGKERLLPFIREADLGIVDLSVTREPFVHNMLAIGRLSAPLIYQDTPNSPPTVAKVTFSHPSKGLNEPVGLDLAEESSGTQALFRNAGAWFNVISSGNVLLIDEIEFKFAHVTCRLFDKYVSFQCY